ncbi:MAG: FIST N-terminal domain-containing protein [Candidatus Korarchaeota archaeon]|nr:FIST C-terminal domain-containing protein [Thermoproteota archaeon]
MVTKATYAYSTKEDYRDAVQEIVSKIEKDIGTPDYIFFALTVEYPVEEVANELYNAFGGKVKIHGLTTSLGVGTPDGFITGPNYKTMGALAVKSTDITFGVGGALIADNAKVAGEEAIKNAMRSAGKNGKKPDLIWLTSTPPFEEQIIAGIESVVGKCPIYGGSAADNTVEGKWKVICGKDVYKNGVSLTAIYTKLKMEFVYMSGYSALKWSGVVTKSKGRVILEIDGNPARDVYNTWTERVFEEKLRTGESILGPASFYPLARKFTVKGVEHWISVHPSRATPEGGIEVFAEVPEGSRIWLLKGDEKVLIERPIRLARACLSAIKEDPKNLAFCLTTYCAGTMFPIKDKIGESIKEVGKIIGVPFIMPFTFGEQGFISGVGNFHANLMASLGLISKKKRKRLGIFPF